MPSRPSHIGTRFNNNRKIRANCEPDELAQLAKRVVYTGNSEHKKNPGDFCLTPPVGARPDKTLCDEAGIFTKKEALRLLRNGIKQGLISEQIRGEFPQNIWAVTDDGIPLQAALHDRTRGAYHGYPVPQTDPFRQQILGRWRES
jgi:hypothetical protein